MPKDKEETPNPKLAQFFFEAEDELNNTPEKIDSLKSLKSQDFPYELIENFDEGGMKTIYRALDRKTRREVALALIKHEAFSEKDLRYFMNEAWITANLQHPNIVPIYDVGLDPEDNPYFTMKLLEGESLQSILKKLHINDPNYIQKYPQSRLLEIFKRICEAVSFAHSKAVAHLDIKPENIHISSFGEVLVLDWGIAKLLNKYHFPETVDDLPSLGLNNLEQTLYGGVRGTPGYMAPEQMKPEYPVDNRADIYGLGAILYSLITYKRPEAKVSTIGKSMTYENDLLDTQTIDAALKSVIDRAMQKFPTNRYQSVAELLSEIEAYQNDRATEAENAGFWRLLSLLIKRNKKLISVLSAVLVMIIILTSAFISELKNKEQLALKNEQRALKNEGEALALLTQLKEEKAQREKSEKTSALHFLRSARMAYQEGRRPEAVQFLNKAWQLAPKDPEVIHFKIEFAVNTQNFNEAWNFAQSHQLTDQGYVRIARLMSKVKTDDSIKLNDKDFETFIDVLIEEGMIVFTNAMLNVFHFQNNGQSFKDKQDYIIKLFKKVNPNAELHYDTSKDRIKISGSPILSYTSICGLSFRELDLSNTPFSEVYMLHTLPNLEYINLANTGVIHIQPIYSMKNIKHLDISGTPIRSLLPHKFPIEMDYLNLSSTLLSAYKGKFRQVHTLDLRNCYSLNPMTVLNVENVPKRLLINRDQLQNSTSFIDKAAEKGLELIFEE